jgi:hypothetical protein
MGKEKVPSQFRAVARVILDETLGFRADFIEHQLAHAVRDPNGRAYIPADSQPAVLLEQDKLEQDKKEEQHGPSTVSIPAREPLPSLAWQDHSLWEEEFSTWALRHCVFRDGCFGSIAGLHLHFCDDCIARDTVACRLPAFEALLIEEGFLFEGGMVAGLLLREDYESAIDFESRPSRKVSG